MNLTDYKEFLSIKRKFHFNVDVYESTTSIIGLEHYYEFLNTDFQIIIEGEMITYEDNPDVLEWYITTYGYKDQLKNISFFSNKSKLTRADK